MGKFKETPSWRGKALRSGFAHWCLCWSLPWAALPWGNKQMANGPSEAAFRVGFLCFRSVCYSALTANSVYSWECKKQAGNSFLIFLKQVTRSKDTWDTRARTHTSTHTHLLTVIVCFLCERKWGRGRGAPAPLKPRGSAPGTHVMNSMCWEMPACGTPQLGTQTQLLFAKIYEADRE